MGAEELSRHLADVRAAVADVRLQLLHPQSVREAEIVQRLSEAIQLFEGVQSDLRSMQVAPEAKEEIRRELQALVKEIAMAGCLAQAAGEHTKFWLGWLSMHFQGYGTNGELTSLPMAGRVELRG
jgi:hypothetical protein